MMSSAKRKTMSQQKKTPFQLQFLEKYYLEEKYPKQTAMEEYAASLNLTYKQIRTWFVERRRKERRENEVRGCNKGLLEGLHKFGYIKSRKNTNVISGLCRNRSKSMISSKYSMAISQELGHSMDTVLFTSNESCKKNRKKPTSRKNCKNSSDMGDMRYNTFSKCHQPCNHKLTVLRGKCCEVANNYQHIGQKNRQVCLQSLFSKDYILKRIFRKDGPPLGVEFDSLPSRSSNFLTASETRLSYRDSQRVPKRKKLLYHTVESGLEDVSTTNYGIGKGLMTVWRATNHNKVNCPSKINILDGGAAQMPFNSSFKETLSRASKGMQQRKLVPKQHSWQRKFQEKRRPPQKRRKVPCSKDANQKRPPWTTCKLAIQDPILEQSNALAQLVDDEELELRDLQAGPKPLRCSAHFASDGRHDCPLCKDLLARFPPEAVKMKQPFCTRPWDTSPELVKKFFKVLRFLYSNAATIEIHPFTIDELAHAFTDKDSMLLGKIHVALLKLLLLDVQREVTAGSISRAPKDGRFLGFLHFVREHEIDVHVWSQSLNALTWAEVLRQVLTAAGFGSKSNSARREIFSKERNQMVKYGLRPRTLKGELFTILSDQGIGGLKVSELAKTSQIVALDLPCTKEETEQLICLTLSSDITLFEKIAPAAYRLRINPNIKGKEEHQSESEDSGSVDDDSGGNSGSSSDESDGSEESNSASHGQRIVKYRHRRKRTGQKVTEYNEIDESYSGEACVLGLMEGEYSDLSIDEKLEALTALVDLAGACSSLGIEERTGDIPETVSSMLYHGSGAKIKKSLMDPHLLSQNLEIVSQASKKGQSSLTKSSIAKDKSGHDLHAMQSICLGSDRRYNNYWLFLGPCDIIDPGHRQVYFESSEDGHWEVINTPQALDALLSALDCRGTREARLFGSLDKREAFLCQAMNDCTATDYISRQKSGPSDLDNNSGGGSSPISDVDNIQDSVDSMKRHSSASCAVAVELGKSRKEKKQKWDRLQAFDKWVWNDFYSDLSAVKRSKRSYMESLARCEQCHDLYWRDEKHCRICHTTFELDFDLEEKYAIHTATCRVTEDSCDFPKYKVLPSQLQALKAATHAIEACMPKVALSDAWSRSAHKLWVKRLKRTSSLPEFLQVLADFVGAINEEWLYECASALGTSTALDEVIVYFQTMPQTTSAVALWMVKLDALIASQLEKVQSEQVAQIAEKRPQPKRRRICTM
ncbi:uncharacterized protein A4U43_C10F19350 [Asparagus officinalis]|uniref:Homeobox domain-containing protein n=1 Tax=Asparagus officinalis TaxID=4686 RepID=A0A5P1E8U7_ASPOF|nr:homeobox-DDT domain protein RLT3-like [Asparagus officinalis]ONK57366.1 uncharacterized protein A4U43_C10F19350 [Asparagus officinalis]